jgi:hypothetical protein
MKPSQIFEVLDLAFQIRKNGEIFNPLFVGPPGVGKSQIVQAYANKKGKPFIDLRAAYLEAPDVIGFPSIEVQKSRSVTVHNIPEFWPTDGEGILLLEEPNRGTTSIMNCFMQLLTDRKVHKYNLPEGWIIVGCINPETEEYDVNTMDAALKNRFEIFNVDYDKKSFVEYMKANEWAKEVIHFVEGGQWTYKKPEEIGNMPGAKYVSPRTLSKLNSVLKCDFHRDNELMFYQTVLGSNIGKDFFNFKHNESPVLMSDIRNNTAQALTRLKHFSDPSNFKNGMISITIQDIIEDNTIENDLLAAVLRVLPVDQGVSLVRDLEYKRKDSTLLNKIVKDFPDIKTLFKETLKGKK